MSTSVISPCRKRALFDFTFSVDNTKALFFANKNRIIFVEVKTRKLETGKFGSGAEAVNHFKQIKILKAVKVFLQKNPKYAEFQPQIDVAVVNLKDVDSSPESVIIIANAVEDWN